MAETIPVVATIGEALRLLRWEGHRVLLLGAALALASVVERALIIQMGIDTNHPDLAQLLPLLPMALPYAILSLPLVTSAHRIVLQGERGRTGLTFGREEWLYVCGGLRLLLPTTAIIVLGVTAISIVVVAHLTAVPAIFVSSLITIGGWVAFSAGICRYLLILPAAAIGERLALRRARELIAGNTWRLFFVLSPLSAVEYLVAHLVTALGDRLWLVGAAIQGPLLAINSVLFAFLLSLTYRRLAETEAHLST